MNTQEQAYINGFVKRASEYGFSETQISNLLKSAGAREQLLQLAKFKGVNPENIELLQKGRDMKAKVIRMLRQPENLQLIKNDPNIHADVSRHFEGFMDHPGWRTAKTTNPWAAFPSHLLSKDKYVNGRVDTSDLNRNAFNYIAGELKASPSGVSEHRSLADRVGQNISSKLTKMSPSSTGPESNVTALADKVRRLG
jgi:hypothetical protein